MTPERWRQVTEVFEAALEREPDQRASFIDEACSGDSALKSEVESLLAADTPKDGFLEASAAEVVASQYLSHEAESKTGQSFGQYKILSLIGIGGMGEVYKARDADLGRDVAVKILPTALSQDAERLRRFKDEARLLGQLNHPNVLAIYYVGTANEAFYVVSELLEGETLRERLNRTQLSPRKAIDYARQIAAGLAAAHHKGIIHRDLKPENIFITHQGDVKILDFGIAKLAKPLDGEAVLTEDPTRRLNTQTGAIIGTLGYMSPEQVQGKAVDHRSDIFSFGTVFYEMLSGKRAFEGESAFDTMNAIVSKEPPELSTIRGRTLPAGLEKIVRRCLEKSPTERFQSASDLTFALASLADVSDAISADIGHSVVTRRIVSGRRKYMPLAIGALILLAVSLPAAYFVGKKAGDKPLPTFRQITFRNGSVWNARFAPDGQNVLYIAGWDGRPDEIYSSRIGSPESRPLELGITGRLLAISRVGEILLSSGGTLSRAPLAGGAPRQVLENVQGADWSPDGSNFAIVRVVEGRYRLEYPVGNVLYETDSRIYQPRFSPQADRIAFFETEAHSGAHSASVFDYVSNLVTIDLTRKRTVLSSGWRLGYGLCWTPASDEVWFTAAATGNDTSLYAANLSGKQRTLLTTPAPIIIYDIAPDGRVLISQHNWRWLLMSLPSGETKERDLSWFDVTSIVDLSADGKLILFSEGGAAAEKKELAYIRKTDGSPAVQIGKGEALALSPDGKSAIMLQRSSSQTQLVLVPTGAGEARQLTNDAINHMDARWFPDGNRILFLGSERGHGARLFVQDLSSSEPPRPVTPEGLDTIGEISPDGKLVAAISPDRKLMLYPLDGDLPPRLVSGATANDALIRWHSDNHTLYVYQRGELPIKIYRLDVETGRREFWKELLPADMTGVVPSFPQIKITPDGKSYAYSYYRNLSQLYLVEGLK
jgi:eukaryotic-like serine/threonine-protein kinase